MQSVKGEKKPTVASYLPWWVIEEGKVTDTDKEQGVRAAQVFVPQSLAMKLTVDHERKRIQVYCISRS